MYAEGERSCSDSPRNRQRSFLGSSEAWLGGIGRSERDGIKSRWCVVSMLRHCAAVEHEPNPRDGSTGNRQMVSRGSCAGRGRPALPAFGDGDVCRCYKCDVPMGSGVDH